MKKDETRRNRKVSNYGHLRQRETTWNPMKSPCQGEGRGFESRLVLFKKTLKNKGFQVIPGTLYFFSTEPLLTDFLTNCDFPLKRAFRRFSELRSGAWIFSPFPDNNFGWC